jgi:hypothetical protein
VKTLQSSGLDRKASRALVACDLWLRLGFVGIVVLGAGLLQLAGGDLQPLTGMALAVAGGGLAWFSWRRAWGLLDRIDRPATGTSGAPDLLLTTVAGTPVRGAGRPALRSARPGAAAHFAGMQPDAPAQ